MSIFSSSASDLLDITRFKQMTDTASKNLLKVGISQQFPYSRADSYINPIKLLINRDTIILQGTK